MIKPAKILIIGLAFALLGYLIFFPVYQKEDPLIAEISVNGMTFTKIDLNTLVASQLIDIPGPIGTSVAEVKPGAIRMKYSPCPDHYCMQTGWINHPSQVIACVPNRIIITITPDKNSIDTISH